MDIDAYLKGMDKAVFNVNKTLLPLLVKDIDSSLSMSHLYLLRYISNFENCIVSEIAQYLGITLSGVTQLVEKLVKKNLVVRERSEKDRRVVYIRITDEGKSLLEKMNENRLKVYSKYLSILTDDELETHFKIIEKLTNYILIQSNK